MGDRATRPPRCHYRTWGKGVMDVATLGRQVEYKRDLVHRYEVAAVRGDLTPQARQMWEQLKDDLVYSTEEYATLRVRQEVLARGV